MSKKRNMSTEVSGTSDHQREVFSGISMQDLVEVEKEWDENGKNPLGYYRTVEEYYAAHKHEKYNYGDGFLPRFFFKKKASLSVRRGAHIHAYVGPNGGGKSLAMVNDTLATLNGIEFVCKEKSHKHPAKVFNGYRRVLSSVRIIDPRTGLDHPLYIPLNDHRKLLFTHHADILMDEVTGLASQDESFQLPIQIKNMLAQLRRRDCTLRWTTPNWTTAAKAIRNVTKAVTYCKGSFPIFEAGATWPSNTFFSWKTYDAQNFEYFNVGTRDRLTPTTFQFYLRPKKCNIADNVYDTRADVLTAGATNDAGICMHCGGKRTLPSCKCERSEVDTEENLAKIAEKIMKKDESIASAFASDSAVAETDETERSSTLSSAIFPKFSVNSFGSNHSDHSHSE